VKQAGAGFRSLKDTWADTTTPHGQLMLTILGGLAEFERTLIRARTGEGRERVKARGVRFGRPKKLSAHQRREALDRINAGEAVAEVARTFGIDRATVYRRDPGDIARERHLKCRRPYSWSTTIFLSYGSSPPCSKTLVARWSRRRGRSEPWTYCAEEETSPL
jgi:DNA invertase Pin-like site-specific DNA recombinase